MPDSQPIDGQKSPEESSSPQVAELLTRRAEAETRLREADMKMKQAKQDIAGFDEQIIAYFQETGMQRSTIAGFTFYLRRDLFAGVADGSERYQACETLRACGLGDLVKENFDTKTLSAWVRERDRLGEALPAEFEGKIKVSETFKVGVRSAA